MTGSTTTAPGTRADRLCWTGFLLVGVLVLAAGALVPALALPSDLLVPAGALGATAYGIRRYRPVFRRPWVLFAGASVAALVYTVTAIVAPQRPPFPSYADGLDLLTYLSLGLGMLALARPAPGRSVWEGAVDAGIVTAGAVIVSWTFVIDPLLRTDGLGGWELTGALAYPILDVLVLSAGARVVFVVGVRNAATLLVLLGLALLLMTDVVLFVAQTEGLPATVTDWAELGWSAANLLVAAAPLHPSMADAGVHLDRGGTVGSRPRMRLYLLLTVLVPALTIGSAAAHGPGGIPARRLVVPLLASAALAALLVLRMGQLAGVAHRRATELDERTAALRQALEEQRALEHELRFRATHDPLTGLGNRALLHERMAEALAHVPDGSVHGLLLLDLDGFKDVNDTLGHPAGDELLVEIADRLRRVAGPGPTLVRLGGDEFAILAVGTTVERLEALAASVLDALRAPCHIGPAFAAVTTSIGLRVVDAPITPTAALRDADLALYEAKGAGKNRIARHGEAADLPQSLIATAVMRPGAAGGTR